jgi:hypothetical protein
LRRRALALVIASLAVAGCSDPGGGACPGERVGTFTLGGALVDAETWCTVEPPGEPPPGGFAAVVRAMAPALTPFRATLVQDPTAGPSPAAALCPDGRLASPYSGARDAAGTFTLQADSGAAVLTACGPSCSASVRDEIVGAASGVAPDGSATGFAGRLVETFDYLGGDCSSCSRAASAGDPGAPLHCVATYTLSSVP